MVHNKLNPAFKRHDEMYQLAYDKLDDEVKGYGSSKFSSSVWKIPFIKALRSRPNLDRHDIPAIIEHKCEACQRSNHPPKHRVHFSGKPYDHDTLEDLDEDDDADDDDGRGSDDDEGDSKKAVEGESFLLGR